MSRIQKRKLLGLLIFTSLLMVALASGLPALELRKGEAISLQFIEGLPAGYTQESPDFSWFIFLVQLLVVALLIILPVYILISILRKSNRKKMLENAVIIGAAFLFLLMVFNLNLPHLSLGDLPILPPAFEGFPEFAPGSSPAFLAEPQSWVLLVIITGIAVLIAGMAFWVMKFYPGSSPQEEQPLEDIAAHARGALERIGEGDLHFNDAIINCYVEMSRTIQEDKGIRREQATTSFEFEEELVALGFPEVPVRRLRQLFEQVRYGHQRASSSELQAAVDSLKQIVAFCKG